MSDITLFIVKINDILNHFIWGPVMLAAFLAVGLMFTVRTRFFQLTHLRDWLEVTVFQIFKNKKVRRTSDRHSISQFQSLCTALAATIGTGSIAGVATAIVAGGPGAVFWMWLSAFLGMMTTFAENTLGIKYRRRNKNGDWIGGAMIYIERGLHCKWLAALFAAFCALASFGIGNMTQVNSIAEGLKHSFQVPPVVTATVLMCLISLVIIGGIKRIAFVTEKVVPFMAVLYIAGGLVIVFAHIGQVPSVLASIFREAFNFRAAGGGFMGYGIAAAMKMGISRGVFSNEAGLGSSVMVHSASDVKEPVVQGMWGIFEVFVDTLVVCTITALVILTGGVYDTEAYAAALQSGAPVLSGTALTSRSFASVIPFGDRFVSVSIVLFAFATLLGWSYYGERCVEYLFGTGAVFPYKLVFVLVILTGCTASLDLVWSISDTLNGFMAVPNLIAITLLSSQVIQMTKGYLDRVSKRRETVTGEML